MCGCSNTSSAKGVDDLSVAGMRRLIDEGIPVGSDKEKVVEFLESRGIHPSEPYSYRDLDESGEEVTLKRMTASIDKQAWFFRKAKLWMAFYFNDQLKLVKYEVKDTFVAP